MQGDTESQGQAGVVEVQTHPPQTIIHQGTAATGVPVQEVQVQYQQLPTAAGTVTLKYDNVAYGNPEFIQIQGCQAAASTSSVQPAGAVAVQTSGTTSSGATVTTYGQEQMDFIVKTVDDLEQLKYGAATSAPTYYIQSATPGTPANLTQLSTQQVVVTQAAGQTIQIQPQTQVRILQHFFCLLTYSHGLETTFYCRL